MPSDKEIQNFVINRLESQDVYDHLIQTGQINDDELYLVQGEGEVATEDKNGLMSSSDKAKLNGIEEGATNTVVDDTLTSTSPTHALSANQGKILNDKIKSISDNIGELGGGDMLKATYDSDDDGKVDAAASADVAANAEKLGGQDPTYYAAKSDIPTIPDAVSAFTNDVGYLTEHQDISGKLDAAGDGSNVVVSFSAASSRANISNGEKLSTLFSKISKWFSDFGTLAFKSTVTKTDLESSVQTSLSKADTALQSYTETDPTVPAWAKESTKPSYTADEVGALPATTIIPTKMSQLTNDSGYLTSHQDISGKLDTSGDGSNVTATFTAATARSNIVTGETLSVILGKIAKWLADLGTMAFTSTVTKSDLSTDIQTSLTRADTALQSYVETDPTVPGWAKAETKPSYTADEVGAISNTLKTNYDVAYTHSQTVHAPADAAPNVQSDWNVTDITSDAYIKNKPDVATQSDLSAIESVLANI